MLGTAGWILFPAISHSALEAFATLARLDDDRLSRIQTPPGWLTDRRCAPYCFGCFLLNDADVAVIRQPTPLAKLTISNNRINDFHFTVHRVLQIQSDFSGR